jgi:hypothetical protein
MISTLTLFSYFYMLILHVYISAFAEEIIPRFRDDELQRHFRLSIDTYKALLDELGPFLKYKERSMGKSSILPEKQILRYYGTCMSQTKTL